MRRKIILHGRLKELWDGEIIVDTETVAEAIKAMCTITGHAFDPVPGKGRHEIRVVGFDRADDLFVPSDVEEIHLVPAFHGGKSGGFFKIVLGAVLIAASFFIPPAGLFGVSWLSGSLFFGMGASLLLGGVMELISPAPKLDLAGNQANDPEASKYLGANGNTVKIGTRIPIIYGKAKAFGHYIGFNVDAVDVAV